MNKRKDGLWQHKISIVVNGVKKQKSFYGKTKAEVLRKISEYKEEETCGDLFKNVAVKWWEEHEPTLAYNTTKPYRPALQRAIDAFGGEPITTITPSRINSFILKFSRNHADKTTRTQLMVINLICRYAVGAGELTFNPAADLKVPKGLPKEKRSMPSQKDIELVKQSVNMPFGLFAYLLLYTGLRRSEALALTNKDIQADRIIVNKTLYQKGTSPSVKLPKTPASLGSVPIVDNLRPYINNLPYIVFPNEKGEYMTNGQFEWEWKKYKRATGVNCSPHQLRHAYATMLFENNVPPQDARILLRHANISTTIDLYTQIREAKRTSIFTSVHGLNI